MVNCNTQGWDYKSPNSDTSTARLFNSLSQFYELLRQNVQFFPRDCFFQLFEKFVALLFQKAILWSFIKYSSFSFSFLPEFLKNQGKTQTSVRSWKLPIRKLIEEIKPVDMGKSESGNPQKYNFNASLTHFESVKVPCKLQVLQSGCLCFFGDLVDLEKARAQLLQGMIEIYYIFFLYFPIKFSFSQSQQTLLSI